MGNILSRIQEIALNEGITIGALERKIGASKGVLSRAINNGTDIQSKWLQTIVENYPTYSTRWLLTGEGSMLRDNKIPEENKVGDVPNVVPTSKPDDSILYNMYKDLQSEKREKESKIEELNAKMLSMSEEIGRLKALAGEESSEEHPKGLGQKTAKDVSTRLHSSQSSPDAPFANAPSDGQ